MSEILRDQADRFANGRDLDGRVAESFLDAMIHSVDEPLLASVFQTWHRKGMTEDEIYSIARIMRDRCIKVRSAHETFIDIVGTGGSKSKTFNVSTASAFVTAGAGLAVAKHGNRAATSSTGSADVLSELGVEPAVDPATAERCLNEIGICFMFAPNFHRLSPTLAKVRRGLGFPTIFNCVGPLCNPAGAPHQVIGVWDKDVAVQIAKALARLGTKRSWVVHGSDGLDELSMNDHTFIAEVTGDTVTRFEVGPEDFGVQRRGVAENRCARDPSESAAMILDLFDNSSAQGWAFELVALNAAGALLASGMEREPVAAFERASTAIRDGSAFGKLRELRQATRGGLGKDDRTTKG